MAPQDLNSQVTQEQVPGLHAKMFDKRKSNVQKYREMVVGEQGIWYWIRYELTMLLFSQIPGALGLLLRKIFYPSLFKKVGKNVIFGRNVMIRHPHKITLGDNVVIDDECLLDAKGEDNEGITIGDGFTVGRYSSILCKNGDISIGSAVNIGTSVKIVVASGGRISIGNSIDIGSSCHFSASSYDYSQKDRLPSSQRVETEGIILEDMAWIGAGVIILDGVTIGAKSIVGAGSVVTDSIPPHKIAVGSPAKVIRDRE